MPQSRGMDNKQIKAAAEAAAEQILKGGQSVSQGDMSVAQAPLPAIKAIIDHEEDKAARKTGLRPLFRNINIGGVS